MNVYHFRRWVRFLRAAGLPAAHSAFILGVDVDEIESVPVSPRFYRGPIGLPRIRRATRNDTGPIRAQNATKIYRMRLLGYSAAEMARILRCEERKVADFLRRIMADDGELLAKPRTRKEQQAVDRNARDRAARVAATIAAKDAAWPLVADARIDPAIELVTLPPAALALSEPLELELPTESPPPPSPEPNRWDPASIKRRRSAKASRPRAGELNGSAKLTWVDVEEIRRLHAAGMSYYALGRLFGVWPNAVKKVILGLTWKLADAIDKPESQASPEPPPPSSPPARADEQTAPPPVPSKAKREPREKSHRFEWKSGMAHTNPVYPDELRLPPIEPVALPPALVVAELPTEAPPPEPNRWDGPLLTGNARLSPLDVKRIRWLAATRFPLRQIALQFDITESYASRIIRGKVYAEPVPSPADGMESTSTG